MRLAGLLWVLACAEVPGPAPASSSGESAEVAAPLVVTGCNGEDATFVRRVLLLAWAEVPPSSVAARVHTDVVAALGRDAWLDRVLAAPRFRAVWEDVLRDWLYLARAGYRDNGACTEGPSLPTATAALAEHIREPLGVAGVVFIVAVARLLLLMVPPIGCWATGTSARCVGWLRRSLRPSVSR